MQQKIKQVFRWSVMTLLSGVALDLLNDIRSGIWGSGPGESIIPPEVGSRLLPMIGLRPYEIEVIYDNMHLSQKYWPNFGIFMLCVSALVSIMDKLDGRVPALETPHSLYSMIKSLTSIGINTAVFFGTLASIYKAMEYAGIGIGYEMLNPITYGLSLRGVQYVSESLSSAASYITESTSNFIRSHQHIQ